MRGRLPGAPWDRRRRLLLQDRSLQRHQKRQSEVQRHSALGGRGVEEGDEGLLGVLFSTQVD